MQTSIGYVLLLFTSQDFGCDALITLFSCKFYTALLSVVFDHNKLNTLFPLLYINC